VKTQEHRGLFPLSKKIIALPSFAVLSTMEVSGTTKLFQSLVFIPEVFDATSWDKPASIFQVNQSAATILSRCDGANCGGVLHGRFHGPDLHRNCAGIRG
jgi:hypothetical protein